MVTNDDAPSVDQYLASLDEPGRIEVERALEAVRANLPAGLHEGVDFDMITWSVPHEGAARHLQRPTVDVRSSGIPQAVHLPGASVVALGKAP